MRQSHINEVLIGDQRDLFEAEEKRIRVKDRTWELDLCTPAEAPSKILFTPVRRKAHPVVMEKGLRPPPKGYVVLTRSKDMAQRIGRRRDPEPVLLQIRTHSARQAGILFFSFGDLFISPGIPSQCIAGPRLPKAVLEQQKAQDKKRREKQPKTAPAPTTPGTFALDPRRDPDRARRTKKGKGKKPKGWKEAVRKQRRRK